MIITCGASFGAKPEAREWNAPDGTLVKYRFHSPAKIEKGKTYPLVLFLHGAGERGDDNAAQLKHGVAPILKAADALDQPCFLIAPQCPTGQWWAPAKRETIQLGDADKPNALLDAVLALVEETTKTQPIDPKRFYVTGLSMGGFGTWTLLGIAPEKIAAAIPICGGGDPALASTFTKVPIHAFHGEADPTVPVRCTKHMISALEKAGAKPKVTYYPEVGHDSWTRTYDNLDVLRWLFDQRLK